MTKPDYTQLLDSEIHAYLTKYVTFGVDCGDDATPDEIRAAYNAAARHFDQPIPQGITCQNQTIAGVPTRLYTENPQASALIIYLHGGGFVVGDLDTHHSICAEICAATRQNVLAVDYRLAPEHPYPAAIDDALAVFDQVSGGLPVILAGDSAGATLSASIAHLRPGKVAGMVLIYPLLDTPGKHRSYYRHSDAPLLSSADMLEYERMYLGDQPRPDNPAYLPMSAAEFGNLPPCYISTAQCDPLCDDGAAYHSQIQRAGGVSTCVEEKGLMHGHLRARPVSTVAQAAFGRITAAISQMAPWNVG